MPERSEVPEGWAEVRVSDICELINGRAFKPIDWSDKGLPIVRIQNLNSPDANFNYCDFEVDNKYIINSGQLLFAWSGTPGTSFGAHIWERGEAVLNQHIFRVEVDERTINKNFLKFALNYNITSYIEKAHGTSGLAHITKGKFENSILTIPPLAEQHRIVAAIEALFARLDAANARLERVPGILKQFRQAVLAAACDGRLTEDWRRHNLDIMSGAKLIDLIKTKHLDAGRKSSTSRKDYSPPQCVDTSNLPVLPQTWAWAALDQLVRVGRPIIYGIIKPGPDTPGGIPYVRVNEMANGVIDGVSKLKRTSEEKASKFARSTLQSGDLLISKDGTIGKVAIVPPELEGGNINQHIVRASIHEDMLREYVVCVLRCPKSQKWLDSKKKGVALQGVNVEDFRKMPIPVPS